MEKVKDRKGASSLDQYKSIGPALETRQSHTIEHRVGKVPQRY